MRAAVCGVSRRFGIGALTVAPLAALAGAVQAQTSSASLFARDHDTPVAIRNFPGLSAVGLPIGDFRLFPELGVGPIATSNVFENNKRSRGDVFAQITPRLDLQYDNSQVTVDAYANGEIDRYASNHSENENQVTVGLDAMRSLPGYSSVFAGGSYGVLALSRLSPESPSDAEQPLRYEEGRADVGGAYERNRIRLTARFDADSLSFDTGERLGGAAFSTGDHDRSRYTATGQASYAISPATALYVGGVYNILNYRLVPPAVPLQRDSHGYEAFIGSSFEFTGLTRADIRVGYLDQEFDAQQLGRIAGFGARGQLEYFPTQLTTVTFQVRRSVEDSGIPNTGGYLESGGTVAVDHEYRRYLMINAKASYFDDKYQGLSRHDGELFATVGATYLSAHHWHLKLAYEYYHQNSSGLAAGVNYDDHRAIATLTFQY